MVAPKALLLDSVFTDEHGEFQTLSQIVLPPAARAWDLINKTWPIWPKYVKKLRA
jgi:hypothetical protein